MHDMEQLLAQTSLAGIPLVQTHQLDQSGYLQQMETQLDALLDKTVHQEHVSSRVASLWHPHQHA
jgi:hypothetical protein